MYFPKPRTQARILIYWNWSINIFNTPCIPQAFHRVLCQERWGSWMRFTFWSRRICVGFFPDLWEWVVKEQVSMFSKKRLPMCSWRYQYNMSGSMKSCWLKLKICPLGEAFEHFEGSFSQKVYFTGRVLSREDGIWMDFWQRGRNLYRPSLHTGHNRGYPFLLSLFLPPPPWLRLLHRQVQTILEAIHLLLPPPPPPTSTKSWKEN